VVEAALGPLTTLSSRKARQQANKLRALLLSEDAASRAQGLALLELCGDWPTLSQLAELVMVSVAGEVLPVEGMFLEDMEDDDRWDLDESGEREHVTREVAWRLAALGGLLVDAPKLKVPPTVARGMGPLLLKLAPVANRVDIPLGRHDRVELVPLPNAALLATTHALCCVPYDTLELKVLLQGDYLEREQLLRAGSVHFAAHDDRLYVIGEDGVPRPPGPERGLGQRGRQLFAVDEKTALLTDGTWLHLLSRLEGRALSRHRLKEASVLCALPSGPLLTHGREAGTCWYPKPGGTRRRLMLGFEPGGEVQCQGTLALLLPSEGFGASGRYAVVNLQTGEWKEHAVPMDLAPRALLEDGRVFACSRHKEKLGARLELWPGLGDEPPRALPPPHARRVKTCVPLPGGRLITAGMEGAVLWDVHTCERLASTGRGVAELKRLPDGRVAVMQEGEPAECWSATDLTRAGAQPGRRGTREWNLHGLRFVYEDRMLRVQFERDGFTAHLDGTRTGG
jgi:hypothetical protein